MDTWRPIVCPSCFVLFSFLCGTFVLCGQVPILPKVSMDAGEHGHDPVLLDQVLSILQPRPGEVALDATTGRGGHALEIAARIGPSGTLLCVDADPENLAYARERLSCVQAKCRFFHANFAEIGDVLATAGCGEIDMILADLGVSTNQLLTGRYGLGFSMDAPLDMRLDPRLTRTAADLVRNLTEKQLADLIFNNAQERLSRRIARRIVETRKTTPIVTTAQLAAVVRSAVGPTPYGQLDSATRTFQALRMAVNEELSSLQSLLDAMPRVVKPQGRAAVISFHSGEDRLVKQAMRQWQTDGRCDILTPKPLIADEIELARNPRSRSAKLRGVRFRQMTGPKEYPLEN